MSEFQTEQASEAQLAALLGELLEAEGTDAARAAAAGDIPAEIAEMRDVARLLRAASQSVPLPEGRLAVRRALLATLPTSLERSSARAAWRRTGRWLGLAATVGLIVAAFGLGAGLLDSIGSPSNPLYGLRRAVDKIRVAFVPGRREGGQSPFVSPQPGFPEIGEIPPSGGARTAGISAYPLSVEFKGVTIPAAPGQEVTVQGTVGGLPVTLSLTATTGCPAGKACGDFQAWVTPLRGTKASPEFGQMRGTFICATGKCTLTPVSKTGVFSTVSAFVSQFSTSGELTGLVGTGFDSLGDWVAAVEQVAEKLKEENLLPQGVTVKDLVRDAATNKSLSKPSPQGMPGPSTPSGTAQSAPKPSQAMPGGSSPSGMATPDVGVPASTRGSGITMGTGTGSSSTPGGGGGLSGLPGLAGPPGPPGGTGTSTTPSTSASGTVTGGTTTSSGGIGASATGGVSGGMSGAYSTELVAGKGGGGGNAGAGGGSATGSAPTSGGIPSTGGVSISAGGISGGVGGGGASASGGGLGGGGLGGLGIK